MSHWNLKPGEHEWEILWQDRKRRAIVYSPPTAPARPPVILAFHGNGVNARQMVDFTGLNELADREGCVIVYPNGEGRVPQARSWNAGNCCGHAHHHGVDDLGFIDRLRYRLVHSGVDPTRIYATGMSNGAMMSYLLAARRAEHFAAIAPVAGPMALEPSDVQPSQAMPICHFHGDCDQYTPFVGGQGSRSISKICFLSIPATIAAWVKANGCREQPRIEPLESSHDDGTSVTLQRHPHPDNSVEVALYVIHGAGHIWPGRDSGWTVLGRPTRNVDANERMWEFFQRYTR